MEHALKTVSSNVWSHVISVVCEVFHCQNIKGADINLHTKSQNLKYEGIVSSHLALGTDADVSGDRRVRLIRRPLYA